jgi:hypothetical protein
MPDFQSNPLFNDKIDSFQGAVPNVSFDYIWDESLARWVPSSGVSVTVENLDLDLNDEATHALLTLTNTKIDTTNSLLAGLPTGGGDNSDLATHDLITLTNIKLDSINTKLGDLGTSDETTHGLLTLSNTKLDSANTKLDSANTKLDSANTKLASLESLTEHTHVMLNQNHTHLQTVKSSVDLLKASNQSDSTLLRAIQTAADIKLGEIKGINTNILAESEESNENLLNVAATNSGILDSSEDLEVLTAESNTLLGEVKQAVEDLELNIAGDAEAHRILSGISGQDKSHYFENEELLRHINDANENSNLALEELKKNYRDLTFHVRKFEEDTIMQECPDETFAPTLSDTRTLVDKIHNKFTTNGRINDATTKEMNQVPIVGEAFSEDGAARYEVFDEAMPFSIKMENYRGSSTGYHSIYPFDKLLGLDDRVTIYNDSPYPFDISFRGGDKTSLPEGFSMELSKEEAAQATIKRDYTISGFEVRYSIERMYTPENSYFDAATDEHPTNLQQTHSRLGINGILGDAQYIYLRFENIWKRVAIASWETCVFRTASSAKIHYFEPYTTESYLYVNTLDGLKRIAITDWTTCERVPLECHNNVWADNNYIYAKTKSNWRKLPLVTDYESI